VAVIRATENLVEKQAEVWQGSLDRAQERWQQSAEAGSEVLANAMSIALSRHVEQLAAVEQRASEQMQRRMEQWQTALSDNARLLHSNQQEMIKQGEVMTQAIRAAGEVTDLEHALNENLHALAGTRDFENMILSLSAAITLLNSRLGKSEERLDPKPPTKGKAA
jgi:hypothetical protein